MRIVCRVQGAGCRVQHIHMRIVRRVQGVACRAQGAAYTYAKSSSSSARCRVQGAGCRVQHIHMRIAVVVAPQHAEMTNVSHFLLLSIHK